MTATPNMAPDTDVLNGRYFNPDDYLETEAGRVFTPERSAAAFEHAYSDLESALRSAPPESHLLVVVGIQGAGKTTWVREHAGELGDAAYFFDAALPRGIHRARAVAIAKSAGVPAVCIWVRASIEDALARNDARRSDHRVPVSAVRSVHSIMEPPSISEGFQEVREVTT